jgi:hypothetical protein
VLEYAKRRYLRLPNVVGIGIGTKYVHRNATDEHLSIQFFVARKMPRRKVSVGHRLPSYLYGRSADGSIDRSYRVITDVIEVGKVRATCGSGSPIESLGQIGAITLLFRNKKRPSESFLLSCAHVAGDLISQIPVSNELHSDCRRRQRPFARTVLAATAENGELSYDIALGRLESSLPANEDLRVETRPPTRLSRFLPREEITAPLLCNCAFPVSNVPTAAIVSFAGQVRVEYPIGELVVRDAFVLGASISGGDSGGLVFVDDAAVGIVFASSPDGFAWFHPLGPAFNFLAQLHGKPLSCFT